MTFRSFVFRSYGSMNSNPKIRVPTYKYIYINYVVIYKNKVSRYLQINISFQVSFSINSTKISHKSQSVGKRDTSMLI